MSDEPESEGRQPACQRIRNELKECITQSNCMRINKKSAKACLTEINSDVPAECHRLRYALFQCKRSLLDNRQRFRGRKDY